jgi:uncharacterized membrane protein YdjX (TVP38/TMEM64 family)
MDQQEERKAIVYRHIERDLFFITLSVLCAILLLRLGVIQDIITASSELKIIGSFFAGFFFTSIFTIAPAAIALSELAKHSDPIFVAFVGAVGSMIGDLVLYLYIKDFFADDIRDLVHTFKNERKITHFFKKGLFRWLSPLLGALIIASPLPDEFALALFGVSRISMRVFIPIAFVMSFGGILFITFLGGLM